MSAVHTNLTVEREPAPGHFVEIKVECQFDFQPEERGKRDEYGQQMEPDHEAGLTFEGATREGVEFELTTREIEAAEQDFWEDYGDF